MKRNPQNRPDPRFIAQQLRKPAGDFAEVIGKKMNQINSFQYDFVLDSMQLKDHEKILEIGFGNGFFFDSLFSRANDLTIYGIDFSEEMVKEAEENNRENISSGKLKLFGGNSDHLPFPANSFDKVFCINVIYFWEQPDIHLGEVNRVLKRGGKFYSVLRTKQSSIGLPFTKHGFVLYELEEWKVVLEKNGFEVAAINQTFEPKIEDSGFNQRAFKTESLCFISEKKHSR